MYTALRYALLGRTAKPTNGRTRATRPSTTLSQNGLQVRLRLLCAIPKATKETGRHTTTHQSELAFQWVDASNVAPGQYWLREDVNPDAVIQEEGTGEKFRYASEPTVIPGYVAKPVAVAATGAPQRIRLESQTFKGTHSWDQPSGHISYSIVAGPKHGVLGPVSGNEVTYTPTGSYAGPDAFTYSARDVNSEFPYSPPTAAVSVEGPAPSVVISGAQPEMISGTSVSLSALVAHDAGNVEWAASGGSLATGPGGRTATYQAPAQTGAVTITARLADDPETATQAAIMIEPVPTPTPSQQLPVSSSGSLGAKATSGISRPRAMIFGRRLVVTTTPGLAGRVRLSAYVHHRRLGTCSAKTPAGRAFTCRLTIPQNVSLRSRFTVIASLRTHQARYASVLGPTLIPKMHMRPVGAVGHAAAGTFWCSPSTLVSVLGGSED